MEACDVLIVGAGPAGLASAACLTQRNIPVVLIEAGPHIGAQWRRHYDRLCLHTTKTHSALPGLPFPREVGTYPSRSQVLDYLESYAARFGIRPRFGEGLQRAGPSRDAGWEVQTSSQRYRARHLIMATGLNRTPVRPVWPRQELARGQVVHSADYQSGAPFTGKRVLVVGMGNTGAEIALDLHEHSARVSLSVRKPRVLDIGTVARIKAGDIEVVPEIEAFSASGMTLKNGATREVDAVVLATGYRSGLEELIDAPSAASNIHFVGYRNSLSGLLRQIGVEAEVVARTIANRAA